MTLGTFSHALNLTKGHAVRAEKDRQETERERDSRRGAAEKESVSQKLSTLNKAAGNSRLGCVHSEANLYEGKTMHRL